MATTSSENERMELEAQGKFYCVEFGFLIALAVFWVILAVLIAFLVQFALITLGAAVMNSFKVFRLPLIFVFTLIIAGFTYAEIRLLFQGREFRYEAYEKEFRIYRVKFGGKRVLQDTFYYTDVTEVTYKKLLFNYGMRITVVTKYRIFKYNYVFMRSVRVRNKESTPFYIIEQHIGNPERSVYGR